MKYFSCSRLVVSTFWLCGALMMPVLSSAQMPDPKMAPAVPQGGGFTSRPVVIAPLSGDDSKEFALISVTIAPGAASPAHTHPGDCVGAVIEGEVDVVTDGQGTKHFASGEGFHNPRGMVHQFRNSGDKPVHLVTTILYDKGKPRVQPVPQK